MKDTTLQELTTLFFTTRQIIRAELPTKDVCDPNEWLYNEVLRFVEQSEGPTMQDIAQHLRVKAPSATSLIAHLVNAGWIERIGSTKDRRIVRIYVTKKGESELKGYTKRSTIMMRKVFSRLDSKEIETLVSILRRVQDTHIKV